MSNIFQQSEELKQALTPFIKKLINETTGECFRTYKAKVTEAPNSSTGKCGVQLVGQTTTFYFPFSTETSGVAVGDMVWVATTYNSWRNAIVWQRVDLKSEKGTSPDIIAETIYIIEVSSTDSLWEQADNKWRVRIAQTTHKLKNIYSIVAERKTESGVYENMIYSYKNYTSGSVAIIVDNKIDIKIIIKGEK